MAKSFMQREEIEYNETISPALCKDSFRIIMAFVDGSREIVYRSHRHSCGRGQGRDRPHRSGAVEVTAAVEAAAAKAEAGSGPDISDTRCCGS
jgi:hypothetical protein